ncbi:D-alanyl-D-alanine carboxypeptidase / D-alanyl-D-alanine-endopeptidase (penicillin-binding protein 4) [Friedmanniella luteola]|uniref:D-alanyl-D-alanine carboxypeptidase / D-alanyl-D-alanine-endopeptidase (Penicillin-binding protein 4) n=1 Tax=Friedmanniella luteola TaxID=546871 RepID=A0A1H1LPZ9_9ACTN|nr:D-alanyl-D-alanine carboxypeptidase/D-alanyl-D-alanine-endopeptidase [Friedmanniella luteola]SDR76576.1 D-alanyl-D-alanine carboxypeptidase / D-alanyl-D-alanine-endopeptidase (penicillin-binding protein 4) [Friedmanniella luteola]
MGPRRFAVALVAMLAVVGVILGLVSGFFASAAGSGLRATGLWSDGGASTVSPGTFDSPAATGTPSATAAADGLPRPVLPAATETRVPSARQVAARVAAVDDAAMGGRFSAQVADLATGEVLYAHRAASPAIPASTTKLLTSTAALSLLGPEHVFTTEVVRAGAGKVVLVGGGDPYLASRAPEAGEPASASLAALAATTAKALRKAGRTEVALGYDASLFSGPAWNPRWPAGYADQVTPVSALWVDEGRTAGVSPGPRVPDPARDAAEAFAAALEKKGVEVTRTAKAEAPASARPLARATSLPLEQVVERLLLASDNDAAEVLLRHVALAAHADGSSAEGTRAVRRTLDRLGLWPDDARLQDGSGLARETRVPAEALVDLLRLAADPAHPELRPVLTGLPVAGVEGSLRNRYGDEASRAGRGLVRGKTGTLTGVHALAGYLRTADGTQLAYAFLVNDATDDFAAKVWLDRVSAALSRCGC